ncbi:phosphoglycerate mutase family domain containing protein [Acanthamoeba castellanii str. Neff]|uniref:phosphoglycerate mutase (2,3-diphosphoglycerate-dependent) n=1 Tax=Acanthamoeba castellanii (strain ATCC 30010 / Neff) TaxID=1257118 RepID=L8H8W9_ACACF|nr:phosphoglycerate mutase family domain containing protein [Acanthamoeba castellanii str. Neff]ELR21178.1 phosphoglycerate mutase family domain containing protein [Acanthamoeba castellanii str. Neff]
MSKLNDDTLWDKQGFKERHTSKYRLTDLGRKQASLAGDYIRKYISKKFDRYYCSEYIRAMETASLLGLDGAQWFCDFYLRERDKGLLGGVSDLQRKEEEHYRSVMAHQERGMTSCSGFKVVMVCHGNIMRAFRVRIERMSQRKFRENEESTDDRDKIWNCQIIHYTRRDPETGIVAPNFYWVRSICPWDTSLSWNVWQPIHRPTYSNEDLAAEVGLVPQLINNDDVELLGQTATEEIVKKRALLTEWKEREEAIAKSDEAEKEKEDKRRARESWLPSNNPSSATSTTTAEGGKGSHHIQQLERVAL